MVGGDPPAGHAGEEGLGVVAMVDRVDVDVVDVQQQVAVGLFQHRFDELCLVQVLAVSGGRMAGVVGDVLHRDAPAEHVLHPADARGDVAHGLGGERDRHQVVEVAVAGAIAQVLAVQRHPVAVEEAPGAGQEGLVQRFQATQRQRQAVAAQRKACRQLVQRLAQPAADADPVVRRAFQEIEGVGRCGAQLLEQCAPQAQPGAYAIPPHLPSPHLPSAPHLPSPALLASVGSALFPPQLPSATLAAWWALRSASSR